MLRKWWPVWLVLLLAAGFFGPLLISPDGFIYRPNSVYSDLTITHWPNALFIRDSLRQWGQVPLWRHLILGGEPFAANPLAGLWYPPNILLLFLPLTPAFNILFALHLAWAGLGGYRLARSAGASRAGALLAALTVMFAPKAVAHLASGHVGLTCAWAWLPWVLWAARRLALGRPSARPSLGDVATLATTGAMLILADVRLGFYGGIAAAGYWAMLTVRRGFCPRSASLAAATALLVSALVAVQVVPLAAVADRLNRGGLSLEESGIASLPPGHLLGLLVADHGGFQEWMTYVGAVGLLLAMVGLARWRSRERWWWGGLALAAVVYSLGTYTPLYRWLYGILPPLGWLRGPARAWFLVVLAAAVLAAQGLTALERTAGRRRRQWLDLVAVGLGGAALAGGVGGWGMRLPANVVIAAALWPAAGALLALRARGRLRSRLFVALVLALALADLWGMGFTLYRVRPADKVLAEGEAAASWLAEQPGPFRVYSPSYSISQQVGAVYELEMADGVDPFQLADYAAFMRLATEIDLPGYSVTIPSFPEVEGEDMLLAHREVVPDLHLLSLLNVRYLAAAYPMEADGLAALGEWDGVHLYRNELVLPRAFVVERVEAVAGLQDALGWLTENGVRAGAVVEDGAPLEGVEGIREAQIVGWTPNRIEVEAEGPGLLVLSEVYDPDWQAKVDGEDAIIVRTDGIFRGIYLESGRHQVRFVYRPAGLALGCGLTTGGWAIAVLMWLAGRRTRRE